MEKVNAIDTSGLKKKTGCDVKIRDIEGKISSITALATTSALTIADNKTPTLVIESKKKFFLIQKYQILRVNSLQHLIIINLQIIYLIQR